MTTSSFAGDAEDRDEHGHDQRDAEEPQSLADRRHASARERAGALEEGERDACLQKEEGSTHEPPPFHDLHWSKKSQ
ncbi:MAG: hypothetical protein P1U58_19335 [Verrucomicrobiales bacterium]|nr:hypothetical protein [Verrucomicrobiales bacterium]